MPHPYEDLYSHMMKLDWKSRHGYIKVALLNASERTRTAVWSYVISRMSPADFVDGEATGIPPPPCITLKDAPRHKKRQLTLTSMFDEQRRKAARP